MSTPERTEYNSGYIRPTTDEDCLTVAADMRHIDQLECLLSQNAMRPLNALRHGLKHDFETWTVCSRKDDEAMACFGVGPLYKDETNYIWLLCTDRLLEEASFEFAKASRKWVSYLVNKYKLPCVNQVHCYNYAAIRWLKWCGAEFDHTIPSDFIPFQLNPSE